MTDKREMVQRRALISLLSSITGKSHSRVISKMRDLEIMSYADFLDKHKEIYREMLADLNDR